MHTERAKYIRMSWWKSALINLFTGTGIAVIICLFRSAANGRIVSSPVFLEHVLFSILITVGVTNGVYLGQTLFKLSFEKIWVFISVYYIFCLLGMAAGIESTFFILSLLKGTPYHFFYGHDYLVSSLIVIIVCTLSYTYHAQKAAMNARIKEKELDMVKLMQLKTQAELATLHSKINPHFLYNSLNSIASLIHHDPDKAETMTLKLSKLFRYSINKNQEDMVSISEEVDTGKTYLDIEKIRFGDRLNFKFEVDEDLLETKVPRFLIQPLVENALKHGLNNMEANGQLLISIKREAEKVAIVVADNGEPFPAELHTGYGIQSTYDKLSLLYGENYQINILNEPQKHIRIIIPVTA